MKQKKLKKAVRALLLALALTIPALAFSACAPVAPIASPIFNWLQPGMRWPVFAALGGMLVAAGCAIMWATLPKKAEPKAQPVKPQHNVPQHTSQNKTVWHSGTHHP